MLVSFIFGSDHVSKANDPFFWTSIEIFFVGQWNKLPPPIDLHPVTCLQGIKVSMPTNQSPGRCKQPSTIGNILVVLDGDIQAVSTSIYAYDSRPQPQPMVHCLTPYSRL